MNCEQEKQICGMEGIQSFPTIKIKKRGMSTKYEAGAYTRPHLSSS